MQQGSRFKGTIQFWNRLQRALIHQTLFISTQKVAKAKSQKEGKKSRYDKRHNMSLEQEYIFH